MLSGTADKNRVCPTASLLFLGISISWYPSDSDRKNIHKKVLMQIQGTSSHLYVHVATYVCMHCIYVRTCLLSLQSDLEDLGMLCVQLATKFLFHCGFHTKKTLRLVSWTG